MNLIESAISPDQVTGDLLQLLYIPLPALANLDAVLAKGNPKRHEIDKLRSSIMQNGFVDPAKWDVNLNGGKGGIIYGNGRTEALVAMLLDMKKGGQSPPRGIGIYGATGEWCVPVKFGVDAESETAAKRFIVDHNLLTASGLSVVDASVMFETEAYLDLLGELKEQDALPLTINEEDYLALVGTGEEEGEGGSGGEGDDDEPDADGVVPREGLVPGSIWQLGRHRLMCGDSTDAGAIALLLEGQKPNIIFADPPYGINIVATNVTVGGGEAYDIPFGGVKNRKGYVGGATATEHPLKPAKSEKGKK